jgi:hypothetical protein
LKIEKFWLLFTVTSKGILCAGRRSGAFREIWIDSYNDWKHIAGAIGRHGTCKILFNSCLIYKHWQLQGTLNEELEANIRKEKIIL